MPLNKYERETQIGFNEGEDMAYIFTYNKSWQRHLEKVLGLKMIKTNGFGGRDYELPKKMIKLPRAPRKLSIETRARMAQNLLKARKTSVYRQDSRKNNKSQRNGHGDRDNVQKSKV